MKQILTATLSLQDKMKMMCNELCFTPDGKTVTVHNDSFVQFDGDSELEIIKTKTGNLLKLVNEQLNLGNDAFNAFGERDFETDIYNLI